MSERRRHNSTPEPDEPSPASPTRRASDQRIDALVESVADMRGAINDLQDQMAANTETTNQIRDIVTAFNVLTRVGKWLGGFGVGIAAVWHGPDAVKAFIQSAAHIKR